MQTSAKVGIAILIILFLIPVVAGEDAIEWYTKAQNVGSERGLYGCGDLLQQRDRA